MNDRMRDGLPVMIGERRYQIDVTKMARRPTQSIRQAVDQGSTPGEGSLDTQGLWRRTGRDFRLGAGQEWFDEAESSQRRFRSSKGVDPWSPRAVQLHHDTALRLTSANTNLPLASAGGRIYVGDGNTLKFTADTEALTVSAGTPTWTTVTSTPASAVSSLTQDGARVFASYGANGIYVNAVNASSASQFSTQACTLVAIANGRMIAANGVNLYEIAANGTATTIYAHANTGWVWTAIWGAPNGIYVAGRAGTDYSVVYLVSIIDATGELAAPFVAAAMQPGEVCYSLAEFGGAVVLGTSVGIRLGAISGSGFLSYGAAIATPAAVKQLLMRGEYCWFAMSNMDATSTGLGRVRLTEFADPDSLVPAYATDIFYGGGGGTATTKQGEVTGIAWLNDRPYFAVSGIGVIGRWLSYLATGTFRSGKITYATAERKAFVGGRIVADPLPAGATVVLAVEDDDAASTTVATLSKVATTEKGGNASIETEHAEVVLTLTRATVTTTGPVVRRFTLYALPVPFKAEEIYLPVNVKSSIEDDGAIIEMDPFDEWQYLKGLEASRERVTLEFGGATSTVVVDAVAVDQGEVTKWSKAEHQRSGNKRFVEGTWLVRLLTQQDFT